MSGRPRERWITGWWPLPAFTGLVAAVALAALALTAHRSPVPVPAQVLLPERPASTAPAQSGAPPTTTPTGGPTAVTSTSAEPPSPAVRVIAPSRDVVEAPEDSPGSHNHTGSDTGGDTGSETGGDGG